MKRRPVSAAVPSQEAETIEEGCCEKSIQKIEISHYLTEVCRFNFATAASPAPLSGASSPFPFAAIPAMPPSTGNTISLAGPHRQ
jgi:hypothetical protein